MRRNDCSLAHLPECMVVMPLSSLCSLKQVPRPQRALDSCFSGALEENNNGEVIGTVREVSFNKVTVTSTSLRTRFSQATANRQHIRTQKKKPPLPLSFLLCN